MQTPKPAAAETTAGIRPSRGRPCWDVYQERCRQRDSEGFDAAHDDAHTLGELAAAASAYAFVAMYSMADRAARPKLLRVPACWPFDPQYWKPTTPRDDLIKAGALILAEMERLDRAAAQAAT